MAKVIKKSIYIVSIASLIFLTFLTIEMLPLIFQSTWQGTFFLVAVILLLLIELIALIKEKNLIKESWSYNIFLIAITLYLTIIYYRIYSNNSFNDLIYTIDIKYCKQNYLILALTCLFIICNLVLIIKDNKKENDL